MDKLFLEEKLNSEELKNIKKFMKELLEYVSFLNRGLSLIGEKPLFFIYKESNYIEINDKGEMKINDICDSKHYIDEDAKEKIKKLYNALS